MAKIVTVAPQNIDPSNEVELKTIIDALPETIPFNENIAIVGRLRYGKDIGNVSFVAQMDRFPSVEMRAYFADLVTQITSGKNYGVLSNSWRKKDFSPLWIYSDGKKIVRFIDGKLYQDVIQPVNLPRWIPLSVIIEQLQNIEWPFNIDCYLTGGLVRQNGSFNDVDFVIGSMTEDENGDAVITQAASPSLICAVRQFLNDKITCSLGVNEFGVCQQVHLDVGSTIMTNKGTVYFYKVFSSGQKQFCGGGLDGG